MFLRARKKPLPDHIELHADGTPLRIRLRADPRARRYLLRLPSDYSGPVLTVPRGGDLERAERFARQHIGWLLERMDARPDHVPLLPGSIIPLRGADHRIVSTGKLRGLVEPVRKDDGHLELQVPGAEEHMPRRLTTWLKGQAKADLTAAANLHAAKIGTTVKAISVRDTKSRWGSCATSGRLSFSWRLILAPPEILDYVAAHEVAHLREMNHSARFWRICEELAPHTGEARAWLKANGHRLHGYG